jgi:hypothetical protein
MERRPRRRRRAGRTAWPVSPLEHVGGDRFGGRGVRDYLALIASRPASRFWLLTALAFLGVTWSQEGVTGALIALAIAGAVVFPLGYLWWRRWGPPA